MPAPTTPARPRSTGAIIAVLSLSGTVVALQQTLVVPLLPDFPKILGTSADNVGWLVTATLLTSAVSTPIASRLADMFGKRLVMLASMAIMVVGSLVAALGASITTVIAGRALQGFATALIPVGISIMRDELPREKIGSAVALMSATLGIGAAIGMPMAGVIYEHLGWHALFWLSAALGVALFVAVLLVVPESTVRTRGKFDYLGAVLLSVALTALLLAISKGGGWGWGSERTVGSFVVAGVVLALWLPYELRVSQPLVDLRTSARRPVLLTNIASLLLGLAMFGNMLATTQQLQMPTITGYGFGLSVIAAGMAMLPGGLVMIALAPVSAVITRRYGAKTTLIVGGLVIAAGYVGRVFLVDSLWQVIVGSTIVSAGTAIGYAAMPTLIMRHVPITETASANGLNSLLRAIGTSTSSALVAVILTSTTMTLGGVDVPTLDAFKHIFWIAAFAAMASAVVAVAIPDRLPTGAVLDGQPALAPADRDELKPAGHEVETVVQGVMRSSAGRPMRGAVVTVLTTDGDHIDWSRANNDGEYSVVMPGPGRYLMVASAEGWAPTSGVVVLGEAITQQAITLRERLTLSGTVTGGGRPLSDALVVLTKPTGESVGSVRTGGDGRFEFPLPTMGRYLITVVDPEGRRTFSRGVILPAAQSSVVDIDAASFEPEVSAG